MEVLRESDKRSYFDLRKISSSLSVCMCVCVYIYIEREREREKERPPFM